MALARQSGTLPCRQCLRTLLAKLGPRSASAALAGLLVADHELVRSASVSIRTRLLGLELPPSFPAGDTCAALASEPFAPSAATTSSALRFLLGLALLEDAALTAVDDAAAELPTRLQKSA